MQSIGDILDLPAHIRGVAFDVDGVLLDSLTGDYDLCVAAAAHVWGDGSWIKPASIKRNFALHSQPFWAALLADKPGGAATGDVARAIAHYDAGRANAHFPRIEAAVDLAKACKAAGLKVAIASSNDGAVLRSILAKAGLSDMFGVICGIDGPDVMGKPAPDIYINAAKAMGLSPDQCAFVEDSITGLNAGCAAGYDYAIGVATGATSFNALVDCGLCEMVFDRFDRASVRLIDGSPTEKTLDTPNDFVSHMIEHIAWRLGTGMDLHWRTGDWPALGAFVGRAVGALNLRRGSAATLGMIDDGAAEVLVDLGGEPGVEFSCHHSFSKHKVAAARVEQVRSGSELLQLLDGLATGLGAKISVRLCTFEDPHHSWEGVFRAVGIALARLREPASGISPAPAEALA